MIPFYGIQSEGGYHPDTGTKHISPIRRLESGLWIRIRSDPDLIVKIRSDPDLDRSEHQYLKKKEMNSFISNMQESIL